MFKGYNFSLIAATIHLGILAVGLLFNGSMFAQEQYPQHYFINPLDIPISLAGTFGEIRPDHYHTGLDIRTDGKEGLPVHAAAGGYVSRIDVSPYGYGNALYITHPNGFISLYGHLSRYNDLIMKYLRNKQYKEEKYVIDITLQPGEIPVTQGDIIAFSGSTGAAVGPHLHFELRRASDSDPINPLLFGYTCVDHLPPLINGISIYPLTDNSSVNGKHRVLYLKTTGRDAMHGVSASYRLADSSPIQAYGTIGIGINSYDVEENVESKNGPYIKVLKDNGDTIYYSRMDELSFGTIRYINGHVDYAEMHDKGDIFEFSYLQDNDRLPIYKKLVNKGRLTCKDSMVHKLEYRISDFNGNTSILNFIVKSGKPATSNNGQLAIDSERTANNHPLPIINWNKAFEYSKNGMKLEIPANALFKDMDFHCSVDTSSTPFSPKRGLERTEISSIYRIQNEETPLSANYTLMIKPRAELPDSLLKKAVMVRIEGNRKVSVGGSWENGYLVSHPKYFGSYAIMLDLYRPVIKPLNIYKDKNMSKDSSIEVEISDNLSGIGSFNGYVDGKWVLFEFNPKKNMIYYTFDEHVSPGKHQLKLVVTDEVGNTNVYKTDFTR